MEVGHSTLIANLHNQDCDCGAWGTIRLLQVRHSAAESDVTEPPLPFGEFLLNKHKLVDFNVGHSAFSSRIERKSRWKRESHHEERTWQLRIMKLFHDLVQLMLSLVSKLTEINRIHQLYEDFEFDRVVSKETVVYSVVFLIYAIFFVSWCRSNMLTSYAGPWWSASMISTSGSSSLGICVLYERVAVVKIDCSLSHSWSQQPSWGVVLENQPRNRNP